MSNVNEIKVNGAQTVKALKFRTTVKKGFHGWQAKSSISVNGYDWEILTMKRYSGEILCNARGGVKEEKDGYSTFMYEQYLDPNISLFSGNKTRCTQKNVESLHSMGLQAFKQLFNEGKLPSRPKS